MTERKKICWQAIQDGWIESKNAGVSKLNDVMELIQKRYPFEESKNKLDNTLNLRAWTDCCREFCEKWFYRGSIVTAAASDK